MTRTPFGQLSLNVAAVADVFAWILPAVVIARAGAGHGCQGLLKITLGMALVLVALFLGLKPAFAWLLRVKAPEGEPSTIVMAALMSGPELFTMLLVMALATTAMTGPLINLFIGRKPAVAADAAHAKP
ncbi:hypothetical protein QMO14_16455 [Variovorax sp. CAN2819]|uniref:hypothetical protein n=1 Tax=Variovorax sp. CAN15 TaxID=3046727 RepID=UPI00264760D5|nr:hypothetical protein [Variovorax sp. CAN15]MDN6885199.1 hypothetical protein [Variovorax sp. CAN15]